MQRGAEVEMWDYDASWTEQAVPWDAGLAKARELTFILYTSLRY